MVDIANGGSFTENDISLSLHALSVFLKAYYGKGCFVFIDEYDSPYDNAFRNGYYEKAQTILSQLFSLLLKVTNNHLSHITILLFGSILQNNGNVKRAMVLGVTEMAQNEQYSGLNNLPVYSMQDAKYQPFFGFTEPELISLLSDTRKSDMESLKKEENDYLVPFLAENDQEIQIRIFNPWTYAILKRTGKYTKFWSNTYHCLILHALFQKSIKHPVLKSLFFGDDPTPVIDIQRGMSYSSLRSIDSKQILTFLFYIGFLTFDKSHSFFRFPAREVSLEISSIYFETNGDKSNKLINYLPRMKL
jgi:Predicted AAA-ATPase